MKIEKTGTGSLRNVLALELVSFSTDVSSDMCFSLVPDFILGLPGGNTSDSRRSRRLGRKPELQPEIRFRGLLKRL